MIPAAKVERGSSALMKRLQLRTTSPKHAYVHQKVEYYQVVLVLRIFKRYRKKKKDEEAQQVTLSLLLSDSTETDAEAAVPKEEERPATATWKIEESKKQEEEGKINESKNTPIIEQQLKTPSGVVRMTQMLLCVFSSQTKRELYVYTEK